MNSAAYLPLYIAELMRAGISSTNLPASLQELIFRFLLARQAWAKEDAATKERLLPVLVKTDAVIAAAIYRLYPPVEEQTKVDKIKLLALRAKALRLKDEE